MKVNYWTADRELRYIAMQSVAPLTVAGVVWCGVASVTNLSVWSELGSDDGGPPGHPHSLSEGGGQAGGQAGEESAGQAQSD